MQELVNTLQDEVSYMDKKKVMHKQIIQMPNTIQLGQGFDDNNDADEINKDTLSFQSMI